MSEPGASLLLALVGEKLASVVFVRDYLQLDFDGPQFSIFAWPRVVVSSNSLRLGDPGYRDALCALIGHAVVAAQESVDTGLTLDLGISTVVVDPDPGEVKGPEIAMLSGFTGRPDWMVWRPGESPFDAPQWL